MKTFKTLFIALALLLVSCSPSKEEILISDYVQTIDNTKTDLNFKLISIEKVSDYSAKDSLEILKVFFETEKAKKIEYFDTMIKLLKIQVVDLNELIKGYNVLIKRHNRNYEYNLELTQKEYDKAIEDIRLYEESIVIYNTTCENTFLEPVLNSINKFESNPDEILYSKYAVKYSIKNPLLNNVKQEISKVYHINTSKTEIIGVED